MTTKYRGAELDVVLLPKMKVEVVVSAVPVEEVIETAEKALYTGNIGDGKIFVYDVENVVKGSLQVTVDLMHCRVMMSFNLCLGQSSNFTIAVRMQVKVEF